MSAPNSTYPMTSVVPNLPSVQLPFDQLKGLLDSKKKVLVIFPNKNNPDIIAAALALYQSLKNHYSTSDFILACPSPLDKQFEAFVAFSQVRDSVGSRQLVIDLGVKAEAVETVSTDENGNFKVSVELKPDQPKIDPDNLHFSYRGVDADLILSLGVFNEHEYDEFINKEPQLFIGRDVVNFSTLPFPLQFGTLKFQHPQSSGLCELVANVCKQLNLAINEDVASTLLSGIEISTGSFLNRTTAETFTLAGWLMQNGAKRGLFVKNTPVNNAPMSQFPSPFGFGQQQTPLAAQFANPNFPQQPPKDWFGPKVFKGGNTLV